ncbi:MAG: hypothetical protein QM778_25275 [Myxococcales bacterium]
MKSGPALALLLPLSSALLASSVHASGPVEVMVGVYVDPENPQRLILRYDNTGSKTGLIYSDDAGANFSLVCTSAVAEAALRALGDGATDVASRTRSSLSRTRMARVTGGGRTLLGTTSGVFEDDGTGCGFHRIDQVAGLWVSGLASTATEPRVSYVLTNGATDNAGEGLWKRDESGTYTQLSGRLVPPDGESWSNTGLLAVARMGGGTRFYTVSLRFAPTGGSKVLLLSSDDGGAHWAEHEITNLPEQASFNLLGVDPTNENRVVGRFQRFKDGGDYESNKDSMVVSSDGGQSFAPWFDGTDFDDVVFEADGTLWIADAGSPSDDTMPKGLLKAAPGLASQPEHVITDREISCLGKPTGSSDLFLCHYSDFGRFDPSTKTFTELASMTSVQSIKSCSGQDVVADCHDQLCQAGWCGPVHFASAPMCGAYHEQYCGPEALHWADAGMPNDAGVATDAGTDGGGDSLLDGGKLPDTSGGAVKKPKEDCSVHPYQRDRAMSLSALFTLLAGVGLHRRRARKEARR